MGPRNHGKFISVIQLRECSPRFVTDNSLSHKPEGLLIPNLGVAIPYFSGSRRDHMIPAVVFQVIWTSSQTYKKQHPSQPSRSPPGFARAARSSLLSVCGAITSHNLLTRSIGAPCAVA